MGKIVHPVAGEISFNALRKFICEGKRNSWASGKKPTEQGCVKHYGYQRGNLFYNNRFIGEEGVIGQEVVTLWPNLISKHIPLWGMNYSDRFSLPADFPKDEAKPFKKEVIQFLKDCLLKVPEDFPFRGPNGQIKSNIMGREIVYVNSPLAMREHSTTQYTGGDFIFQEFQGFETIYLNPHKKGINDREIFELTYHGKLLVPLEYIKD